MHTPSTSFSDEFDLLANVDCFLRRGPESPWGIDWWVRRENADDFATYLDIIDIPYLRHIAHDDFDAFVRL